MDASGNGVVALFAEPWPEPVDLRVPMGVHTGEAHERDGDDFGPPVNLAARQTSAATRTAIELADEVAASKVGTWARIILADALTRRADAGAREAIRGAVSGSSPEPSTSTNSRP